MRYALVAGLMATAYAFAGAPVRPECTAERAGRLWPEEANENPKFAAALTPYGFPEVCAFRDGKYAWRSYTVPVKQLKKRAPEKPSKSRATSGR